MRGELSVNSAKLSVNAAEFQFFEDFCSFHTSNAIRPNFSEFHRIFSEFSENRRDWPPPIFLLRTNFQTLDAGDRRSIPVLFLSRWTQVLRFPSSHSASVVVF
jgi:hypothetical protein